jgi:hypothetical protein
MTDMTANEAHVHEEYIYILSIERNGIVRVRTKTTEYIVKYEGLS